MCLKTRLMSAAPSRPTVTPLLNHAGHVERRPLDVARALLPLVVGGRPVSECDPAYPTVCLPPPPPDLDCPEVLPLVTFQALPADPHHLDADRDGIACESP